MRSMYTLYEITFAGHLDEELFRIFIYVFGLAGVGNWLSLSCFAVKHGSTRNWPTYARPVIDGVFLGQHILFSVFFAAFSFA